MHNYLTSLKKQHDAYKKLEEKLRQFLEEHMRGDIDSISFDEDYVRIDTTERCRGETYRETYIVPFGYFENAETFVNNIMKFRN